MSTQVQVHRRQFVLSRRPVMLTRQWKQIILREGWILSYDPALAVTRRGGKLVLGRNIEVDGGSAGGAGRFCIVDYPYVFTDALALLNLYYCDRGPDSFITSSPAICELLGAPRATDRELRWSPIDWNVTGMNFYPVPGSPLAGVRRLLRDQALDLSDFSIEHRPEASIVPQSQDASPVVMLCEALQRAVLGLKGEGRLLLALSAGIDSRTLAAALLSMDIDFECVTQDVDPRMSHDLVIAADVCRFLGVEHHVVRRRARNENLLRAWRRHTLGSYSDADDNVLFPYDQWQFLSEDAILLKGGNLGIGRRSMERRLAGLDYESATGEALFGRFERRRDAHALASLDEWLAWRRGHDNGFDLPDGFKIDQRLGGWWAALEQGADMLLGECVDPGNSQLAVRALMTPRPSERGDGRLQMEAIAQMAPDLLRFPMLDNTGERYPV